LKTVITPLFRARIQIKIKKECLFFMGALLIYLRAYKKTSNNTQPAGTVIIWANFHNVMSSLILSGRNY
jgi:hypothetical protein